ncbi:hypothetical protein [Cloacibacillus evryensis]|uniref:PglD-related sugar-binding protein n=1 Tax=Cloacibacillus evryensis TaxID=508460 RepID=UPI0026E0646B|nr:hypothetical protein [Cloacibacillus evryensis]
MNKNLLILGAGQYGLVAREIALSTRCFEKIDFLDDKSGLAIGRLEDCEKYAADYSCAIAAIGNSELRMSWLEKLSETFLQIAILASPQAYVSPSARLKKGCIVEPMAAIGTEAELSVGVIISAGAVIGHNALIGDGCHIDCGAVVRPNSILPAGTKVECGEIAGMNNLLTRENANV